MGNSKNLKFLISIIIIIFILNGSLLSQEAEMVIINGTIYTAEDSNPTVSAIAIINGKIADIGTDKKIKAYIGKNTEILDLKGKTAIPGFIESHGHFIGLGKNKKRLDLKKANNWDDIIMMVKKKAETAKKGEWIVGRGWHQEKWNTKIKKIFKGLPYHNKLSEISQDNPVLLHHASGHSIFVNKKAMDISGITNKTINPSGGEIVKDKNGVIVGVFRETAEELILKKYNEKISKRSKEETKRDLMESIELAQKECLENGIATFFDAGVSFKNIDIYKSMAKSKALKIRLNVMVSENNKDLTKGLSNYKLNTYINKKLSIKAIKRIFDGALGSHGAWFLEPYNSLPSSTGLNTDPIFEMEKTAEIAIRNNLQFCTHAIGDRANREILNIYEKVFKKYPKKKDLRWRVEHAQHINPSDIPRFKKLGVIASMQGIHCTSDGPWVEKRIGKKRSEEGAYVWQKLIKQGTIICNGTDVPVEDVNPIDCFYSSITRRSKDGSTFYENQKMTRKQALYSYTINGAYAAFEEKIKGSIKVGKLADITVLSDDIMKIDEEKIKNTKILYTIINGKILYKR